MQTNNIFPSTSLTTEPAVQQEHFKILLVDDLKENLILLEDMLEAPNRIFVKASNGEEALTFALKQPDIGLILLDVHMPVMDGFEVAHLLRSNPKTRNIPVIFVTASSNQDSNVIEGFKSGAVDYLIKPLNTTITRAKVTVFENLNLQQQKLKKAIEERDKVNEQLDKFTRVMAHDLKTPLAGIVSLISLIRMNEQIEEIEDIQEELNLLETLSTNLSDMITSVLTDSRKLHDENQNEDVSTEHIIRASISMLQAPTHLRFKIEDDLPIFKTRKVKLQQVFQNLIGNAIKYNNKADGLISIGYSVEAEFYQFYVRDNGPGIEAAYLQTIFEEFGRGTAKSQLDSSTGLGLHFIKNIVEEQGGKIWAESVPGEGSVFYFLWKR